METSPRRDGLASEQIGPRALLGQRGFRTLWAAQLISDFGDSLTNLALLFLITTLTGSTTAVATLLIAIAVPQVAIGLLAGVYVDRWDRRRTMIGADVLRAALVLGFAIIGVVGAAERLWLLYLLAGLQAAIGTFFTPARMALLPTLVPEGGLLAANALIQSGGMVARVVGTGVAGVALGLLDQPWSLFIADAATFLLAAVLVALIAAPPGRAQARGDAGRGVRSDLLVGLQQFARSRLLGGALAAIMIAMLGLGAVNVLMVPFILTDLQVPITWFGAIEFAQTASMVLSGGLVATIAARWRPARIIGGGLLALGLLVGLLGTIERAWHLILLLFAVGWILTPLQAAVTTVLQTHVAPGERGRAGAVLNTALGTANLLSMALAGLLGDIAGIRAIFLWSGALTFAAGLVALRLLRPGQGHVATALGLPAGEEG